MKDNSNWTLLEYEDWFIEYSSKDWSRYLDFTKDRREFGYNERGILMKMEQNAERRGRLNFNQLKFAKQVVDKIKSIENKESYAEQFEKTSAREEVRNLTIRLAWHDNKWDGHICQDPKTNFYCTGYKSLLSDRLRERKQTDLEQFHHGESLDTFKKNGTTDEEKKYIPPCFWSINAFGNEQISIEHDNPAASKLKHIKESLPPCSVFSWPFGLSFVRDWETNKSDGKYPRNLENIRIPKFQNKLIKNETIVFLYLNYDNPISGDDQKYLVAGCGLLMEKGDKTRFEEPADEFEIIKKRPGSLYFPHINWALRYSLYYPGNFVRLPYHEYLEDAKMTKNYERLNNIKVTIDEPELEHCFKYVAMDIDDDEAIYVLSKIRQKFLFIKDDGIVNPESVEQDLQKISRLLKLAWERRGYFPSFLRLSRLILEREDENLKVANLLDELKANEGDEYPAKFVELLEDPNSDKNYSMYKSELLDLQEKIQDNYYIEIRDLIRLCMLNLTPHQFKRILSGKLSNDVQRNIDEISKNLYLLFEEYELPVKSDGNPDVDAIINKVTGEQIDFPIELFKIDIAYFPNTEFLYRLDIQREIRYNDRRRIRALIIQYLQGLEVYGHCFDDATNIQESLKQYPLFYQSDKEYRLPENHLLKLSDSDESHLAEKLQIIDSNDTKYFYLKEIYEAEQFISNKLKNFLKNEELKFTFKNSSKYINNSAMHLKKRLKKRFNESEFIDERTKLYDNVYKKRLYIISGAPGSGKSYEILNIIQQFKKKEEYLLLAPTGKAVLRLRTDRDFDGIEAKTIDKFLSDYKRGRVNPLQYHNLIIDEMSMVDLIKFRDLLQCFNLNNPDFKRIILVGDRYQIPPIGFGKVFIDLIQYLQRNEEYRDNFIELEVNCRLETDETILDFSKIYSNQNILYEELLEKASRGGALSKGFHIDYWGSNEDLISKLEKHIKGVDHDNKCQGDINLILNKLFGLSKEGNIKDSEAKPPFSLDTFQIISPYRAHFGVSMVNEFVQMNIKKNVPFAHISSIVLRHSDKVIQTENDYYNDELQLSNGSMGLIVNEGKRTLFYFPEKDYEPITKHDFKYKSLELAYCITIHKSQGSGFDHVIVIIPQKLSILSKELMYTALTRSKKTITILLEGKASQPYEETLFEIIRRRSYTETRKTSLLGLPFWDFSLEPEKGRYVQSRVEYIIYKKLMDFKEKHTGFNFEYEKYPEINGKCIKVKTDFTIVNEAGKTYYWEHLGLLGERYYENRWKIKYEIYKKEGLLDYLVTTDERHGINDDKIEQIIKDINKGTIKNEDKYKRYSNTHNYLR